MPRRHRYGNPDGNQQEIADYATDHLDAEVRNTTAVGRGFADLVIGWRGLTVLVEVKRAGRKSKLRESQEDFRKRWRGGPYLVVESGADLLQQLLALDVRTPPVRGVPIPMGLAEAVQKAATAIQAQERLKAEGQVLPVGYQTDLKALLEEFGRSILTWQEQRRPGDSSATVGA